MSSITKRLKAAIAKSGLSYSDIEEKLELQEGTVNKWVTSKEVPDTETVKKLATLLGVSADSILFGVERIGEMKAMFPNEATPQNTPMSDWRFLVGAIMVFVGAAGMLLMCMRYVGEGLELSLIFEILGLPAFIFTGVAFAGIILCIVSTVISLHVPKKKKKVK